MYEYYCSIIAQGNFIWIDSTENQLLYNDEGKNQPLISGNFSY
jgi:hypothetical protein